MSWAGTLGNAFNSLLSAEERVSLFCLMLPLNFSADYDGVAVLKF